MVRKVLIIKTGALGDIILSSVFIQTLKKNFPDAEIYLITKKIYKEAVENCPIFKKIVYLQNKFIFDLIKIYPLRRKKFEIIFDLNGNSYTKKIPSWIYNLSDKQIGSFLKGLFSGDGCVSDKEILFSVRSRELVEDISALLLRFGIISRNSNTLSKGYYLEKKRDMFHCRIGATKMLKRFLDNIGFLVKSKQNRLIKLISRISTHDTSDVIPLSL